MNTQRIYKQFPASSHNIDNIDVSSSEDFDNVREKNQTLYQDRMQYSGMRSKKLSINIGNPSKKKYKNSRFNNGKNITTATEFYQKYEILCKIGEGGSSVVKLCKEVKGEQLMVVKIIKYSDTERVFGVKYLFEYQNIIQEEKILSGLDHPNIIKTNGFYIDTTKKTCYIIMELANGKSLSSLTLERFPFTNYKLSQITKSLLETLKYMHLNHICHRDITPDNIIYDQGTKQIKLIDFSISKDLGNCLVNGKMYTQQGNIAFMSPEVLQGKIYDKSVDIWGIGITILSTLLGFNPFVDENGFEMSTIKNICEKELNYSEYTELDTKAVDLIKQMLQKDPKKRISIKSALEHEWLDQKIDKQELISPLLNQYKFQRHSIYIFPSSNLSLINHSNKINYKRGSLLAMKYIQRQEYFNKADENLYVNAQIDNA